MYVGIGRAVNFWRGERCGNHFIVATEGMGPRLGQVSDGLKTEGRDKVFGCKPEDPSQEEKVLRIALRERTGRYQ